MDTKTVKQINQIDAKRQLGLPLTAEEEALFELYGIPRIMQVQPASNSDRLDEVKRKAVFVEYYLSPLLRAADLSITDAKYNFYPETNEEIVTVTYKNNFTRNVYVTADSFRAIITDVMAQV